MKRDFKHKLEVEERIFHLDVKALGDYNEGFKRAYENGDRYELDIKLNQLFLICPRKNQRKQQYDRLVRFLALKGITLDITSRKKKRTP